MGPSTTTTTSTSMAEPGDLISPEGGRPWEDQTLPAQERYDAYRSVITDKCQALRESLKREGVTAEEKRVLAEDPNNKALVAELRQLQGETAEGFCDRFDGGPIKRVLGKNFLGAAEWQQGFNVAVGPVPPIPKWITKELLEGDCELHPGQSVKDTHLLVLMPKSVDGEPTGSGLSFLRTLGLLPKNVGREPYSALKLGELCAKKTGSGKRLIHDQENWTNDRKGDSWAQALQQDSEWVLIPKSDPSPNKVTKDKHFRSKTTSEQADVYGRYAEHYREAKALEVMTAALLNDVVNGEPRMLAPEGRNRNYLRCVEPNDSGGRVVVGPFLADGLFVGVALDDDDHADVGGALVRKSKI